MANIVGGIRVFPLQVTHNNTISVSEIVVLDFFSQSRCVLESLNVGQSLKNVIPGTFGVCV